MQLIHGECIEKMKDIDDSSIDMVFCDLPYGITSNSWDSVINLTDLWNSYNRIVKETGVTVLTASSPFDKILGCSNLKQLKYEWIWQKDTSTGFLNAKHMPLKEHENVLIFYRKKCTYNPQMKHGFKPYICKSGRSSTNYREGIDNHITISNGERFPTSIIKFSRDSEKLHPTQKPVALVEYMIRTYTNEGDTVIDNCMGSGTTGIACLNTNRNFVGIEMNDEYYSKAKERILNHQIKIESSASLSDIFE